MRVAAVAGGRSPIVASCSAARSQRRAVQWGTRPRRNLPRRSSGGAPGPTLDLAPATRSFRYADAFTGTRRLEAYERLLHDAMIGDHTLFNGTAEVERFWEISVGLLEDPPAPVSYACGSWGLELLFIASPHPPTAAPESALRSGRFKTR
ncbi:MAG: hypothetical protein ACRDMJ_17730 [Solirubrobacteraceae bacterium]